MGIGAKAAHSAFAVRSAEDGVAWGLAEPGWLPLGGGGGPRLAWLYERNRGENKNEDVMRNHGDACSFCTHCVGQALAAERS